MTTLLQSIDNLPADERLRIARHILDTLDRTSAEIPPAQLAELERRIAYYAQHPEELLPIEQTLSRMSPKLCSES